MFRATYPRYLNFKQIAKTQKRLIDPSKIQFLLDNGMDLKQALEIYEQNCERSINYSNHSNNPKQLLDTLESCFSLLKTKEEKENF